MKKLLILAGTAFLSACSMQYQTLDQDSLLYVNSQTKECSGVGPMTCLQVRTTEDQDWQLFYQKIEGFDYEPGYQYQLQVKKETVENPPADSSSIKYTLVKIISKLEVKDIQ